MGALLVTWWVLCMLPRGGTLDCLFVLIFLIVALLYPKRAQNWSIGSWIVPVFPLLWMGGSISILKLQLFINNQSRHFIYIWYISWIRVYWNDVNCALSDSGACRCLEIRTIQKFKSCFYSSYIGLTFPPSCLQRDGYLLLFHNFWIYIVHVLSSSFGRPYSCAKLGRRHCHLEEQGFGYRF